MSRRFGWAFLSLVIPTLTACSSLISSPQTTSGETGAAATQTSDGGGVTVSVTWEGPAAGAIFEVRADTHSVDLDGLDLSTASLRNDRGEALEPDRWSAPPGGHHRQGRLVFQGNAAEFFARAKWVELTLPGIGDVPIRTLRWDVAT